jgi:hypothetical protein
MKRSSIVVAFAAVLATLVATTAAFASGPNGNTLFRYVGQFKGLDGTSVKLTVQNGNRPALRSLLGQSQEQTFATDNHTVVIRWTHGTPQQVNIANLALNDYVTVNVRADRNSPLGDITGKPAASIADRGQTLNTPDKPLYLFRGTLVSKPTADGKVTINVKGGNRRALRLMIGNGPTQTFSTNEDTVFLHWAHRVPSLTNAAGLDTGDRIVIRIRAVAGLDLAHVEAIAAKRVADREPKTQESNQNAQA